LFLTLVMTNCSGDKAESICTPDAIQDCICTADGEGVQTCSEDGTGWQDCKCKVVNVNSDGSDGGSVSDDKDTEGNDSAFDAVTLTVSASPANLTADGHSTSIITAIITDAKGNPVINGTTCNFSTNDGELSALTATTTQGVATVTYTAPNYVPSGGSTTITAETTNSIKNSTVMTLIGSQIDSISLAASLTSLPADGTSTANIIATVSAPGGSSAPDGTTVTFSIYKFSVPDTSGGSITSSVNTSAW